MLRTPRGVVAIVVLALVLAACGDDDGAGTTTTVMPPPDTAPPVSGTPSTSVAPVASTTGQPSDESPGSWDEFEPAFMAACSTDLGTEQCACMFEEFRQRYAFADFFDWAYQAEDDPRVTEVIDLCSG